MVIKMIKEPDVTYEIVGDYTIDIMGMDSLYYHLLEKYEGQTIEIAVRLSGLTVQESPGS